MATAAVTIVAVTVTATGEQCCQMAKFGPFLSLDWAGMEGVGAQSKERKGSKFFHLATLLPGGRDRHRYHRRRGRRHQDLEQRPLGRHNNNRPSRVTE